MDPAINAAVAQAHTAGILTSASLLIGAAHAEEAADFARRHPSLGVGVHLCLVDGRPVAPPGKITALTADANALPPNPLALSVRLACCRGAVAAVETELRAQLEKFLATGLRPTHADTHQHTHVHPQVLRIVARLAHEYAIPWVRGPVEPLWSSWQCDGRHPLRTLARWSVFGTCGARSARRLRQRRLRTADRAVGVLNSGQLSEAFLLAYLPRLTDGVTEFIFHPATGAIHVAGRCPPGYDPVGELHALCSPHVRTLVAGLSIRLVNFRELDGS